MTKREARRLAWRAAYGVLSESEIPTSPPSIDGTCESESSSRNFARWEEAWERVLEQAASRGGYIGNDGKWKD